MKNLFIILFFIALFEESALFAQKKMNLSEANQTYQKALGQLQACQFDSSIYNFSQVADWYKFSKNYSQYLSCQNKITEALWRSYQIRKAQVYVKNTLKEATETDYKNKQAEAEALNNYGWIHIELGNYELALKMFSQALERTEKDSTEIMIWAMLGVGEVNFLLDKYKVTLPYFQNSLEISKKILTEQHPTTGQCLLRLGNFYRNQGNYGLALENAEKAQEIFEKTFGYKHLYVADAYLLLGNIFRDKRSYQKAVEYYQEAQLIYKTYLPPTHPQSAYCTIGIADVLTQQEKYEEAQNLYQEAIGAYQQAVGEYHPGVVLCFLGLGNMYLYKQSYDLALDYYNKVLDINYDLRGENTKTSSNAHNNMASIYYFDGNFETARMNFKKALEIDQTLYGTKHPNVANAYYNIAKVYEEQGKFETALEFLQLAVCASITDFNDENIYINPPLKNYHDENDLFYYLRFKAETLQKGFERGGSANLKGLKIALQTYLLCDQLIEVIRRSHTSEEDKIGLGKDANKLYTSAATASYNLYKFVNQYNIVDLDTDKDLPSLRREYLDYFYYFSEKNKSAVLSAALIDAKAKSFGGIPDSLLVRETNLKKEIAEYKLELATKPDSLTEIFYKEKLFHANRTYENLIEYFEKNFPKYYELKYDLQIVTTQRLQEILHEETAIVSYFNLVGRMYVTYLTKKNYQVFEVEKEIDFDKLIMVLRNSILFKIKSMYVQNATKLYKQFFPFPLPPEVKKLVIIPEGNISVIPFEVLLTRPLIEGENYPTFPYLIKNYSVSYAFSSNLLYQTLYAEEEDQTKHADYKMFLGIAPVFEKKAEVSSEAQATLKQMDNAAQEGNNDTNLAVLGKVFTGGSITPIVGTVKELQAIDSMFRKNNMASDIHLRDNANENFVKKNGLSKYKYLHIATHGFVNAEKPDLSGILLAQMSDKDQDGILYSGEIYNLNLDCELVTLSACETGLGKLTRGEGMIGLSRALLYAGAENIMVSLWKVADESTQKLMIDFYDFMLHHTQEQKTTALQKAKLRMMEHPQYSAPYFWSPFVLIGE